MSDAGDLSRLERLVREERLGAGGYDVESSPEYEQLRLEEVRASCALAGVAMTRDEIAALTLRGIAAAPRALDELILVADYAAAARYAASAPYAGSRHPFLATAEIVELHARALRRVPEAHPGTWRRTTVAPFASGIVAPPAWLVPRDIATFVDRTGAGPPADESPLLWIAAAHERFARIRPFASGNGRVGRLLINLLLRRLGLPPFYVAARERASYERALRAGDARDHVPLARMLARTSLANVRRLQAAVDPRDRLVPLARLAEPHEREALYKAAQRGRLRALRRGGTILTTLADIAAYRASRSAAGRRAEARAGEE